MTTNEIANKYGVATFEICKKLDLDIFPIFSYAIFKGEDGNPKEPVLVLTNNDCYCVQTSKEQYGKLLSLIDAPQMHEIARLIPTNYVGMESNDTAMYFKYLSVSGSHFISFVKRYNTVSDSDISVYIKDKNYAEAYAQIYLLLKEKGYIK